MRVVGACSTSPSLASLDSHLGIDDTAEGASWTRLFSRPSTDPIENVTEALTLKGGFDRFLPKGARRVAVERGRRGHADIEVMTSPNTVAIGIEVKLRSQVNWITYDGVNLTSQLDQMAKDAGRLLVVTTDGHARAPSHGRQARNIFPLSAWPISPRHLA